MSLFGRRRRSSPAEDAAREHTKGTAERTREWLPRLREGGWLLPPSLARDDVVPSTTRVGVVDGAVTSEVDSRGLVVLATHSLSVDWWIGAEDRWHLPAREAGVTQERVDHAPVVETTMRVPGGTVVHRVYGTRGSHYPGGDDWLVVEVENRSAVPVALAWAVRPLLAAAVGSVFSLELEPPFGAPADSTGTQVLDALGPVGLLPRAPSRTARRDDGTDPVHQVVAGDAQFGTLPFRGGDASGAAEETYHLASAALLVPLPHTATARLVLFPHGVDDEVAVADETRSGFALSWPTDLPAADAVARGWTQLAEQGPRVELPDPVLAAAVAAARRSLPLAHRVRRERAASDQAAPPATHVVTTGDGRGPADPVGDRMEILAALSWWGEHDAVDRVLPTWPAGQQRGGGFGTPEATAAALRALAVHAVASGDVGPAQAWLPEVGGAVEHLGKVLRKPPPGTDRAAVAEGLDAGALLLARLDQPEAAARIAADATAPPPSDRPAGPGGDVDLDAPSLTPRVLATRAVAAARDGAPSAALWALLRRASATWTWSDPERWVGDDGLVPARLLDAVARLLVADRPAGPAVLPWLPPSWWGRGWEVHGAPTRWGQLSYAVRWHGDRPALLWELAGDAEGDLVVTAPGLDPTWSSGDRRGEALLAPVPVPPEVAAEEGTDAASGVAVAAPPRSVWRPQDPGPDAPAASPSAPDPEPRPDPEPPDGGSFT